MLSQFSRQDWKAIFWASVILPVLLACVLVRIINDVPSLCTAICLSIWLIAPVTGIYSGIKAFAQPDLSDHIITIKHEDELRITLAGYKKTGVTNVRIVNKNDELVCDVCRLMSTKIIPIDAALERMPIPRLCTNAENGCRCSYTPHYD